MNPDSPIAPSITDLINAPLVDDAAIERRLRTLLLDPGQPRRRAVWLILIGPDDRQLPVLVPIDDAPARPQRDLLDGITQMIHEVVGHSGGVVFALERRGTSRVGPDDVAWFTGLHQSAATVDLRVRGVYLVTGSDVRPLTLDDAT